MRGNLAIAALGFSILATVSATAQSISDDAIPFEAPEFVSSWLVSDAKPLDPRAVLQCDAAFAKYGVDPTFELAPLGDTTVSWRAIEADERGLVRVASSSACATIQSKTDRVVLAEVEGAVRFFVNGAGFAGDPERRGYGGVPIALKAGANRIVVTEIDGPLRFAFRDPIKPLRIGTWDMIRPNVFEGEYSWARDASFLVLNTSTDTYPLHVHYGGDVEGLFGYNWDDGLRLKPLCGAMVPVPAGGLGTLVPEDRDRIRIPVEVWADEFGQADGARFLLDFDVAHVPMTTRFAGFSQVDGSLRWTEDSPIASTADASRRRALRAHLGHAEETWGEEHRTFERGPLPHAFDNRFVFVFGTHGSHEETDVLFERARCDQEVWWYRTGGLPCILGDDEFLAGQWKDMGVFSRESRNVVLYGNAESNSAFESLLGKDCPLHVHQDSISVGDRRIEGGALGCAFAFAFDPTHGASGEILTRIERRAASRLIGVFGNTGVAGARLGYALAPIPSNAEWPDVLVFGRSSSNGGAPVELLRASLTKDWKLAAPNAK